jgi:Reverse transcriptase (RNA-dependent DNA polymerase)
MPFSLHTSLFHFQCTIMSVLGNLIGNGVSIYLDDIVIYSNGEKNHLKLIAEVVKRLTTFGLKGQRKKCIFLSSEIEFLGHVISEHHTEAPNEKLNNILNVELPTTPKQLRSF